MNLSYVVLLVIAGRSMITASPSKRGNSGEIMHFPDSTEVEIPESCRNLTYCTIPPKDYPFNEFNEMFKNYKLAPQPKLVLPPVNLNTRGEFDDDCETIITYEPLYTVRDKRGNEWHTVVQASEHNYVQMVRLETCKNVGNTCFKHLEELQDSFTTYCAQKHNNWKILVKKPGRMEPEEIEAVLPVCCSCHYKAKE